MCVCVCACGVILVNILVHNLAPKQKFLAPPLFLMDAKLKDMPMQKAKTIFTTKIQYIQYKIGKKLKRMAFYIYIKNNNNKKKNQ